MNRAGGPFYHLRALHAARRRWQPFREAIGAFLVESFPSATSLIVVGPSAAYCIPDAFLARFSAVTALEPDRVARFLFARRLKRLGVPSIDFVVEDRLVAPLVSGGPGLDSLLDASPGRAVLFSNVLGQIRFLLSAPDFQKWQAGWTQRVASRLAGRPWASFHDRVSAAVPPRVAMPHRTFRRLEDAELGRFFYSEREGRVELYDHLTDGLFPVEAPHAYFHWELEPGAHHLVEGVRSTAPEPQVTDP